MFTIILFACRRDFIKELKVTPLSLNEAQNWYEGKARPRSTSGNYDKKVLKNFTAYWNKAKAYEDEEYYAVECPIQLEKSLGFSIVEKGNPAGDINGDSRLLVLKDKHTGVIVSVIMHIYAEEGSNALDVTYEKKNNKFNGYVFYTDEDANFLKGWQYKKGKQVKSASKQNTGTTARTTTPSEQECTTTVTYWYIRDCTEYASGATQCTPWEYIGETYETYCTYGSGGGETTNPATSPKDPCTTAKNNNTNAAMLVSQFDSIATPDGIKVESVIGNHISDPNERSISIGVKITPSNAISGLAGDPVYLDPSDYKTTVITTGTTNSVSTTWQASSADQMYIIAAIHTHPPGQYTAPSAGDAYFLHTASANPNFKYHFIWAADGSKYLTTVTDRAKYDNFVANNSKANSVGSNNEWNPGSPMGNEYAKTYKFLKDKMGMSDNAANEAAMAYIFGEYAGLTLSKQDAATREFKSIYVKKDTTKPVKKNTNPVLPATNNCN